MKKSNRVKRSRDGNRTYTDSKSGVTAVVKCGGHKKIVSTWKDNIHESGRVTERLSTACPDENDVDTCDNNGDVFEKKNERANKQIVTTSETYARYQTNLVPIPSGSKVISSAKISDTESIFLLLDLTTATVATSWS